MINEDSCISYFIIGISILAVFTFSGIAIYVFYQRLVSDPERYTRRIEAALSEDDFKKAGEELNRGLNYVRHDKAKAMLFNTMVEGLQSSEMPVEEAAEWWYETVEMQLRAAQSAPKYAHSLPLNKWYYHARITQHPRLWWICRRAAEIALDAGAQVPTARVLKTIADIELAILSGRESEDSLTRRQRLDELTGVKGWEEKIEMVKVLCDLRYVRRERKTRRSAQVEDLRQLAMSNLLSSVTRQSADVVVKTTALRVLAGEYNEEAWRLLGEHEILAELLEELDKSPSESSRKEIKGEAFLLSFLVRHFTPPPGAVTEENRHYLEKIQQRAQELLEVDAQSPSARIALAEAALRQGDMRRAEKHFRWLVERYQETAPVTVEAVLLELAYRHALPKLAGILAATAQQDVTSRTMTREQLSELKSVSDKIAELKGQDADIVRIIRARILLHQDKPLAAVSRLLKDRSVTEELLNSYDYILARGLYELDELGTAVNHLENIRNRQGRGMLYQTYQDAETLLTEGLLQLAEWREAGKIIDSWSKPENMLPEQPRRWLAAIRRETYRVAGMEETAELAERLEHAVELMPREYHPQLFRLIAELRMRAGEKEIGINELHTYIADNPENGEVAGILLQQLVEDDQEDDQEEEETLKIAEAMLTSLPETPVTSELKRLPVLQLLAPENLPLLTTAAKPGNEILPIWLRYLARQEKWQELAEETGRICAELNYECVDGFRILQSFSTMETEQPLEILIRTAEEQDAAAWFLDSGRAILALQRDKFERALELISPLTEEYPFISFFAKIRGDAELQLGKMQEARASFQRAVTFKPQYAAAYIGLYHCENYFGRHNAALKALADAWLWSRSPEVRDGFLDYAEEHNGKSEVLRARRKMAERHPEDSDNILALAELLAETGQAEKAKSLLESRELSEDFEQ